MLRLRSNGRPIMNCLQLYREANIRDLLKQPDEFRHFVHAHCLFGAKDRLLEKVLCAMDHAIEDTDLSNLGDILQKDKSLAKEQKEEIQRYRKHVETIAGQRNENSQWTDRVTIIGLLSHIPSEQLTVQLNRRDRNDVERGKTKKIPADNIIQEQNTPNLPTAVINGGACDGISFEDVHELRLTNSEYQLAYNDGLKLKDKQTIHTYCLIGERAAGISISFVEPKGRTISKELIKQGERLYINAVDQTVVCLLPRRIRMGDSVLERGTARMLVKNGKTIPGTETVTSFAMDVQAGQTRIIWVKNGRPDGNFNDSQIASASNVVEVVLRGEKYYLLRSTGLVISNDLRFHNRTCVVSLNSCLGGK